MAAQTAAVHRLYPYSWVSAPQALGTLVIRSINDLLQILSHFLLTHDLGMWHMNQMPCSW
jgi:hypothetical protein